MPYQILGEIVLDTQVRAVSDFAKGQPNAIARAITFWPKRGTIVSSPPELRENDV